MKRNRFLEAIGFRFIINWTLKRNDKGTYRPFEIHRVRNITPLCNIDKIKFGGYATLWKVRQLTKYRPENYDGCGHCNKDFHTV